MFTENELQNPSASLFPPHSVPTVEVEEYNPSVVSFKEGAESMMPKGTWTAHYRIFAVDDPVQRADLEAVMTDCLNGKKMLLSEQSNWDQKNGFLRVALKWGTFIETK